MPQAHVEPVQTGATTPVQNPLLAGTQDPLLAAVLQSLDDDQAQDVVTIDLEGKSSIADHMVIASGRSSRQVTAIAQKLAERLKHAGHGNSRIEGLPAADWVLVDAGGVVVHLFRPEVRTFYNLERMWGFGEGSAGAA
jgi:ribosome-associated protein